MGKKQVTVQSTDETGNSITIWALDGSKIEGVSAADISLEPNELNHVYLTIRGAVVDVTGLLHEVKFKCPGCDFTVTHECKGSDAGSNGNSSGSTLRPIKGN